MTLSVNPKKGENMAQKANHRNDNLNSDINEELEVIFQLAAINAIRKLTTTATSAKGYNPKGFGYFVYQDDREYPDIRFDRHSYRKPAVASGRVILREAKMPRIERGTQVVVTWKSVQLPYDPEDETRKSAVLWCLRKDLEAANQKVNGQSNDDAEPANRLQVPVYPKNRKFRIVSHNGTEVFHGTFGELESLSSGRFRKSSFQFQELIGQNWKVTGDPRKS
jgi:hypothetical protein